MPECTTEVTTYSNTSTTESSMPTLQFYTEPSMFRLLIGRYGLKVRVISPPVGLAHSQTESVLFFHFHLDEVNLKRCSCGYSTWVRMRLRRILSPPDHKWTSSSYYYYYYSSSSKLFFFFWPNPFLPWPNDSQLTAKWLKDCHVILFSASVRQNWQNLLYERENVFSMSFWKR